MSKLNFTNINVQRMLNVLNEMCSKFYICSFLSFENLSTRLDEIRTKITNSEIMNDIEEHFEKIKAFRESQIEIKEEEKELDKNSEEEAEDEDEGQPKEKEQTKKEKKDLKDLKEDAPETIDLAKSIRKFCRKYYRDKEFIKTIKAIISDLDKKPNPEKKNDTDIKDFMKDLEEKFMVYYQKKTKMTLEEEESEIKLNATLNQKISDLEMQINTKQKKFEKLKIDRRDFKEDCLKKRAEINNDIEKLKTNTTDELNALGEKINNELNDKKNQNDKELSGLKNELNKVTEEFKAKTKKDNEEEATRKGEYTKAEEQLKATIKEYDDQMFIFKKEIEEKTKQKELLNGLLNNNKKELDTVENKYHVFNENFLLTQQKCKDIDYDNKVKERAVEWMQAQFRGFWTRKAMRKKYKFLNVLRAPKIKPPEDDKNKKGKKK